MKTHLNTQRTSLVNWLVSLLVGLLSNPQRVRFVVTLAVVCLLVAALLIPALTAVADGLPGGGSFSPF